VTRDANAAADNTPVTQETSPAPAFAPTVRGTGGAPDRPNAVAPRGIY
jgi:hypothetical protein